MYYQPQTTSFFKNPIFIGTVLFSVASTIAVLSYQPWSTMNVVPTSTPQANFIKKPLMFEVNKGQTNPVVKYLSRGDGYITYFTPSEIVMDFRTPPHHAERHGKLKFVNEPELESNTVLRMEFLGANRNPIIIGKDEQTLKSNYLIGNDRSKWQKNVTNYGKVNYRKLYPGIDMVFYGNQNQLEYDIQVSPGADPSVPRFQVKGAKNITTNPQGDLILSASKTESIMMHKPIIYQMINGKKQAIEGNFVINKDQVGFQVGRYDKSHTLIIDPAITYSSYIGGSGGDNVVLAIQLDKTQQKSLYLTGYTNSTDFPTTTGSYQTTNKGRGRNAFVTKIESTANRYVYSTYLGGSGGNDEGFAIDIDGVESAYVTGETNSKDFPTKNPFQATNRGARDFSAFVTKLTPEGDDLVYSTYLGGSGENQEGNGIVVDPQGHAFVTGETTSKDFPIKNAIQTTNKGPKFTAYVTKFNSLGNDVLFSTYLGGSGGQDEGNAIALGDNNQIALTGETNSKDFPTLNPIQATPKPTGAAQTGWVAEMDASNGTLIFSTYWGGSGGNDYPTAIDVGPAQNIYVGGYTNSLDFPLRNAFQTTNKGAGNGRGFTGFVTKFQQAGRGVIYSTYLGGSGGNDRVQGIKVDAIRQPHIVGQTNSNDFPTLNAIQPTNLGAGTTAFHTMLLEDGSLYQSTYYGGSGGEDIAYAVAVDTLLNSYIGGSTNSSNFPLVSPIQSTKTSAIMGFFAKYSP